VGEASGMANFFGFSGNPSKAGAGQDGNAFANEPGFEDAAYDIERASLNDAGTNQL